MGISLIAGCFGSRWTAGEMQTDKIGEKRITQQLQKRGNIAELSFAYIYKSVLFFLKTNTILRSL